MMRDDLLDEALAKTTTCLQVLYLEARKLAEEHAHQLDALKAEVDALKSARDDWKARCLDVEAALAKTREGK